MRFVSKNSNLMIVLTPGIPAQPLSGTPARPGLYIKFKGGICEIKDEETIKQMLAHPGCNADFIAVEETAKVQDPFSSNRSEEEPAHHIAELKYGHLESPKSTAKKQKMTPEMKKLITSLASELAMEQLKAILPQAVEMAMKQKEAKKETKAVVEE